MTGNALILVTAASISGCATVTAEASEASGGPNPVAVSDVPEPLSSGQHSPPDESITTLRRVRKDLVARLRSALERSRRDREAYLEDLKGTTKNLDVDTLRALEERAIDIFDRHDARIEEEIAALERADAPPTVDTVTPSGEPAGGTRKRGSAHIAPIAAGPDYARWVQDRLPEAKRDLGGLTEGGN